MSKIIEKDVENEVVNFVEMPWTIIGSYYKNCHLQRLVRHQLESYNNFINFQIQRTIEMFSPIRIVTDQDYDQMTDNYSLEIIIHMDNFSINRPQIHENDGAVKLMFPKEARLRNFTYSSVTYIDLNIEYIVRTGKELENVKTYRKQIPKVHMGKIPIMLKSDICVLNQYKHYNSSETGECKYDPGGYFIINGSEKVILGQERSAENKAYVFDIRKNNTKYMWNCEIRSVSHSQCISPKQINLYLSNKSNEFGHPIYVNISTNRVKKPIPIFIVFRALGVISDKDICDKILLDIDNEKNSVLLNNLQASAIDAHEYKTQEECIEYLMTQAKFVALNMDKETGQLKKRKFVIDILENDLFPHCYNAIQKQYYLGYMCNKILKAYNGYIMPDDRDSYANKRLDLCGASLNNLHRNNLNRYTKDAKKMIMKEIKSGTWRSTNNYENILNLTNINKIFKSSTLENGIKRALSTGDFSIKNGTGAKVGVAQVLSRLTYTASLSHLRRVSAPIEKSGKLIAPRKLHNSSWGYLCPVETPEGHSVGVVKNLSYMSHTTIYSNNSALMENVLPLIETIETIISEKKSLFGKTKVFVNGCWIGVTNTPYEVYLALKDKKYRGIINIYTSVVFAYSQNEIRVCNDVGRLMRPVLKVKDNKLILKNDILGRLQSGNIVWDDLLSNCYIPESVIEYIDPEEQEYSMIAMNAKILSKVEKNGQIFKYTHCEIHPSTIFGILASCTPFPEHNQSPRNTYQAAQGKQAMGVYVTNYDERVDKTAYLLNYPMRPLVDTRIMTMMKLDKIPTGTNLIVAIMTHTGYNQEDSILINQGSIDRGLALATLYHTEKDEDSEKRNGEAEIRCKPNPMITKKMKTVNGYANYDKLNSSGMVPVNTLIENRDIIMGKVIPIKENRNDPTKTTKYEDQSKMHKTFEDTYIDKNVVDRNGGGYNFAKVKIRTLRKPVIGDKFSSRHGQKGTIGNIIPECDMPFTEDGVKPDIIINPHAIPSRMTIGQLKETLLGKVLLEIGLFGDGTSFEELSVSKICHILQENGYESTGEELLHNGLTGEQLECSVFIGPVFYQRLKHMVNDKVHSRAKGPPVNLTRQPSEGRSKDGGLRFGEMEKDCMVSHGASRFTKDRIYYASDKYAVYICKKCGVIAAYNDKRHIHCCRMCENTTSFAYVKIPYACKLLFQELSVMNVTPRLMTE